jgi:nucleoside-diphosphate-sugar epimerase
MQTPKALVVGGNGYLGSVIKQNLLESNYHTYILSRDGQAPTLNAFDVVVYAHGVKGNLSNESEAQNFIKTIELIEENYQIKKSILLSSTRLEYSQYSDYASSRSVAEEIILRKSENNLVIRMSNVVSVEMPNTSFIGRLINYSNDKSKAKSFDSVIAQKKSRDYLHRNEIGKLLLNYVGAEHTGRVRFGNPDLISNEQLVQILNLERYIKFSESERLDQRRVDFLDDYTLRQPNLLLDSSASILACKK